MNRAPAKAMVPIMAIRHCRVCSGAKAVIGSPESVHRVARQMCVDRDCKRKVALAADGQQSRVTLPHFG